MCRARHVTSLRSCVRPDTGAVQSRILPGISPFSTHGRSLALYASERRPRAATNKEKDHETPSTKSTESRDSAQAKPVAAVSELPSLAGTDEEGFVKDTTPKVKSPSSF